MAPIVGNRFQVTCPACIRQERQLREIKRLAKQQNNGQDTSEGNFFTDNDIGFFGKTVGVILVLYIVFGIIHTPLAFIANMYAGIPFGEAVSASMDSRYGWIGAVAVWISFAFLLYGVIKRKNNPDIFVGACVVSVICLIFIVFGIGAIKEGSKIAKEKVEDNKKANN